MDYEHFYRYLDSRPAAEIKDCVRRVLEVARKHSISVEDEGCAKDGKVASGELSKQHRLQVSQQVWFQHAICSRFGPSLDEKASLKDLGEAAANLCASPEVNEFIAHVNKSVDDKIKGTATAKEGIKTSSKSVSTSATDRFEPTSTRNNTTGRIKKEEKEASSASYATSDSEESASMSSSSADSDAVRKKRPRCCQQPGAKMTWSPAHDAVLEAAVAKYKEKGWATVAKHTGGVTKTQCMNRWLSHIQPLQKGLRADTDWTNRELSALKDLVRKHTISPYWSKICKGVTKPRINWTSVGNELGRLPSKCKDKWRFWSKGRDKLTGDSH